MRGLFIFILVSYMGLTAAVLNNGGNKEPSSEGYQYPKPTPPTPAPTPRPTTYPPHQDNTGYRYPQPQPQLPAQIYPAYYQQSIQHPAAAIDTSGFGSQAFPQNTPEFFVPNVMKGQHGVTPTHTEAYFVTQPNFERPGAGIPTQNVDTVQGQQQEAIKGQGGYSYQHNYQRPGLLGQQQQQTGLENSNFGGSTIAAFSNGGYSNGPSYTRPSSTNSFATSSASSSTHEPSYTRPSSMNLYTKPFSSSALSESSYPRPPLTNSSPSSSSSSGSIYSTPSASSTFSTPSLSNFPTQPSYTKPSLSSESYLAPASTPSSTGSYFSRPSNSFATSSATSSSASSSSSSAFSSFSSGSTLTAPDTLPQSSRINDIPHNFPGQSTALNGGQISAPTTGLNPHLPNRLPHSTFAKGTTPAFRPLEATSSTPHKQYPEDSMLTGEQRPANPSGYYLQMQSHSYEMPFVDSTPTTQQQNFPRDEFSAIQKQNDINYNHQRPVDPIAAGPMTPSMQNYFQYSPAMSQNSQAPLASNYQNHQVPSYNQHGQPVPAAPLNYYNQRQSSDGGNSNLSPPSKLYQPPYYK